MIGKTERQRVNIARPIHILGTIRSALEVEEGRRLDQKAIAAYAGQPETTFSNWTIGGTELTQMEALLRLLERLSETGRHTVLSRFLRIYPTLSAPILAHDPVAVDALRQLARESEGLTLIQAENQFVRSCVFTAVGHETTRTGSSLRSISGFDVTGDRVFVPIPGVIYLAPLTSRSELQKRILPWLEAPNGRGHPLCVNGVWCASQHIQEKLISESRHRHVITADSTKFDAGSLGRRCGRSARPVTLLSATEAGGERIKIDFRRL